MERAGDLVRTVVAHQGAEGSFSHVAAVCLFGPGAEYLGTTRFSEIFEAVAAGRADAGVVPIENSLAGSVHENVDLLSRGGVAVTAESFRKIEHHLLVPKGRRPPGGAAGLRRILSHPKALEQCARLLGDECRLAELVAAPDTATAAIRVRDADDPLTAAIAGAAAAELYGLDVLRANVEDDPHNWTRFLVVRRASVAADAPGDKYSLVAGLPHAPGSLCRLLSVLSGAGADLTKIESRPLHGAPFEYSFFIEFEAPDGTAAALAAEAASSVKVVGRYPAAPRPGAPRSPSPEPP